ncbi:hypothetical protein GCM10023144_10540 [Pigmentiphaga soli]|uniref:Uncharacterized protein n=1 Tax=Pigmentiphaga soli TaxID=1007095 RepID=A0ABP8GMI5_9BURK
MIRLLGHVANSILGAPVESKKFILFMFKIDLVHVEGEREARLDGSRRARPAPPF